MINTLDLFPVLDAELIALLKSLSSEDWKQPTRAPLWTVKDIASHLLDGNLRMLSASRDHYFGDPVDLQSYKELVAYLNGLNADWTKATRRLSPQVLISLLESTGREYYQHLCELDMLAPAIFSVAWAGEQQSDNWFHIAREYTEKWHHQQQIREAVGKPGIMTRALYHPVLQTFMKAFPFHYKNVRSIVGYVIRVTITGDAGGVWYYRFDGERWREAGPESLVITSISIHENEAWKLFTKGLSAAEARNSVIVEGNGELAIPFLSIISIMG